MGNLNYLELKYEPGIWRLLFIICWDPSDNEMVDIELMFTCPIKIHHRPTRLLHDMNFPIQQWYKVTLFFLSVEELQALKWEITGCPTDLYRLRTRLLIIFQKPVEVKSLEHSCKYEILQFPFPAFTWFSYWPRNALFVNLVAMDGWISEQTPALLHPPISL